MKKTALGLALAITMSAVVACAPADDPEAQQQGRGYRGMHYDQEGIAHDYRGYDRDGAVRDYGPNWRYGRGDGRIFGAGRDQFGGGGLFGGRDHTMQGDRDLFGDRRGMGDMARGWDGVYDGRLSERLSEEVEEMEGVRNATVLVYDRDVVCGIETEADADAEEVKDNVREELVEELEGRDVHVSADEDVRDQIVTMSRQLRDGQPVRNAADRIGRMIQQIGGTLRR